MRGKGGGDVDEEEDIAILAVLDFNSSRVFVGTIGRPETYSA